MNVRFERLAVAAAVVGFAACVDGEAPTGVGEPRVVSVRAVPSFAVEPAAAVVEGLDRARVRLIDTETDSVVALAELAIAPSESEWVFDFQLELMDDEVRNVRIDAELIDEGPVGEIVEFAGRSSFQLRSSFEAERRRLLQMGRGPLANLALTGLDASGARSRVQEGASDRLVVTLSGTAPGQRVFFESSDPTIATIDSVGNIRALAPGDARVITAAGLFADTLDLRVGRVTLPPTPSLEGRLGAVTEYVTGELFLSSFSDPVAAQGLREGIDALTVELFARRGFEAVGRFEDVQETWEQYGEGTELGLLDGPQLGVVLVTLIHAADLLGVDFPRN
jgi:hypothetical protein